MNICEICREGLGSLRACDSHRVGKHGYAFSIRDSARDDDWRRFSVVELNSFGWNRDKRGRWRKRSISGSQNDGASSALLREVA